MKRAILAVGLACALASSGAVGASADYPPSGAVVVLSGDIVTGGAVEVTVQNCVVGEPLVTTLGAMTAVDSVCETAASGFAQTASVSGRRPGQSNYQLSLPLEPGIVRGQVELIGTGQVLSFSLDVATPRPVRERVIVASSEGMPGWPFLLLAGLLIVGVLLLGMRRQRELEIP